MIEKFQADIGAKIKDFMNKMKKVDAQVRKTAMGATKPVDADIKKFQSKMAEVEALSKLAARDLEVDVNADISEFLRKAAQLAVVARAMERDSIVVSIKANFANFQNKLGSIANAIRSFEEVAGATFRGVGLSLSTGLVPVLASLGGLIGNLGPMIGTIAGSTFALASAFGTAGIAAGGFGAIAVTNLKSVFGASEELGKLRDKLADTTDEEERLEIMKEMERVQGSLNKEQTKALTSMNKLSSTWSKIASSFESQTIDIFTRSLGLLEKLLVRLKPMFEGVMNAATNLMGSLERSFDSKPMKAFFDYLNTSAGPMLETITKAVGRFFQGFLNMMVAFGPLATDTANGFLKMGEGFARWAAGLSESSKFQSFVDYVRENMPKIRSIFSDAIQGMINMFAAFGPSSSDMMDGLESMMERFKAWSANLSENDGFQKFIAYVKENGPKVVSLIGNITMFLINLGIGMAGIGSKVIELVNGFLSWSSSMMEANPIIGKVIAFLITFTGVILAVLPNILTLGTLFAGAGKTIFKALTSIWNIALRVLPYLARAFGFLTGPIGLVISIVITLGIIIAKNWDWIKEKTALLWSSMVELFNAGITWIKDLVSRVMGSEMVTEFMKTFEFWKNAFSATWEAIKAKANEFITLFVAAFNIFMDKVKEKVSTGMTLIKSAFTVAWDNIMAFLQPGLSVLGDLFSKTMDFIGSVVGLGMAFIESTISAIWGAIQTVFRVGWEIIEGLFVAAMRFLRGDVEGGMERINETVSNVMGIISDFISTTWENIKSTFSDALSNLVSSTQTFFEDVVGTVREKMSEAAETVSEFVGEMPGRVLDFVDDMVSAGADLVGGVISGIKSKIDEGLGVIGGLATSLISRFKRDTDTHSPSRAFANVSKWFAPGIVKGINQTSNKAYNAITQLSNGLTNAFAPKLAMADMQANATLNTSIRRADMKAVQHSFATDIGEIDLNQSDTVIMMDKKVVGRIVAEDVKEENERQAKMTKSTRRR